VTGWIEREDGLADAARELWRLFRRAWARPVITLGLTLLATGLLSAKVARKAASFESQVVFRVSEGDFELATASTPARALRDYLKTVVFSTEALLEIMKNHKLNPSRVKSAPVEAVEEMREEDIEVVVSKN